MTLKARVRAAWSGAAPRRILVTGSRTWWDLLTVWFALREHATPGSTLVHGGAQGADQMAGWCATKLGLRVEVHPYKAALGRAGGVVRNQEMVALGADMCLAFIKAHSGGATHCANAARKAGIPVFKYLED